MKNKNDLKLKLKKVHTVLRIILIFFVIIIIFNLAIFGAYIYKEKGNISSAAIDMAKTYVGKQEPILGVVLGISEDTNAILTDTILLCGYNPETQKAFVVSIPRDTLISNKTKINSLYNKDINLLLDSIYEITGLKVDNYLVIKNKVFRQIVDSLGGIEFDVPIDMNYDDVTQNLHIHLKKGIQTLDGNKAEGLVRFRHNNNGTTYSEEYGDNDYGRMRTQRAFVKACIQKVLSVNDWDVVTEIVTSLFDNIKTNASLKTVISYIPYAAEISTDNIEFKQIPGKSVLIKNIWFFEADKKETKELINELLEFAEINN